MASVISLRYAATCAVCGDALSPGAKASWDKDARAATCLDCLTVAGGPATDDPVSATAPAVPLPLPVNAGASAQRENERRHDRRERALEERWGRFAGVAKLLSDDPQSTKAWAKGAKGERMLAASLKRRVGDDAVVLNDRKVPGTGANIDHIAVAESGVWVIDAKTYDGKVEHRDVGGWFRSDRRVYVNGRDRTNVIDGMDRQVAAVRKALGDLETPVLPVVCFVFSDWPLFAKPFRHDGVWVTWPKELAKMIVTPGPLEPEQATRIAETLAAKLPPA